MKYLRSINNFNKLKKINEYWFPRDVYFIPKNKQEVTSYLEYQGNYLTEILGNNRNLVNLINYIKSIYNDPESIVELFDAHIMAHKTEDSEDTYTRQVDGFYLQITNPADKEIIKEELSDLGDISVIGISGQPHVKLNLREPIQLTFNLNYMGDSN